MTIPEAETISVLLIEDNPGDARIIQEMLLDVQHAAFRVERVDRLASGLSRLHIGNTFDVVLTDLGLPDSQGWETFARVRDRAPDLPIIVLTGLDDEAVAVKAIGEGAQDYLVKGQVEDYLLPRSIRYAIGRKRAEAERAALLAQMQAQVQQVAHILDTMPVGVVLLDREGLVLLANPTALHVPAGLIDIAIGAQLTHIGEVPFAVFITTVELWQEIADDQHVYQVMARPVSSDEGSALGEWVMVIDDVTEKRSVQEQLQRQERLAAVGQLAAGIAHDFNNILSIIGIQTELAAGTADLAQRVRERLAIISEQTNVATTLVQQILDFGRRAILKRQVLDLRPLLETQVRMLWRILPENIEIVFTCAPGTYRVAADSTRMQQMVMNLAVNARDAMPQGGTLHIELSLAAHTGSPPDAAMPDVDCVRLDIADSGTGIAPNVMPHLFEPFFTTKPRGRGTGLGLAQVYGIVKQHGGEILTRSVVGDGTRFTIYLPVASPEPQASAAADRQENCLGHGESILLVEDNELLLEAMSEMLEVIGYAVVQAHNGREAIARLEDSAISVDLVLTDLVMPGMGGDTLLIEIRRRGLHTPVVILSGHPLTGELDALMASGLSGWLLKPANRNELCQMLASVLAQ